MSGKIKGIHYGTNEPVTLSIEEGIIREIHPLLTNQKDSLPYIAPGLVDLQINGYFGYDFNSLPISEELVIDVTKELWKEGVTSYFPTIITNSDQAIEDAIKVIVNACKNDPVTNSCIKGIHIEGPFISKEDGPRGAHGKEFVKAPDYTLYKRWQAVAEGKIKILTLSPEWEGSIEFIKKCVKDGVIISIGHTAATPEQIEAAVQAGARMSTHLGNGAHLMLPRHPNYIWQQLAEDNLWTCLIADGFHLPQSFLKVAIRTKPAKTMLVSDAVYLSGLEPGEYNTHIGGEVVLTAEGKLHTKENPNILAGSAQMLRHGINHLINNNIATLQEAWDMASIRPSSFIQESTKLGLSIGAPADLVVFAKEINRIKILQCYKTGNLVYAI